jgi:hypothetical protein
MEIQLLERRIRILLLSFIVALIFSGITAFPLKWELGLLHRLIADTESPLRAILPDLAHWIDYVQTGLQETYQKYPFIGYGTDWLAFAHIVIAIAFLGPIKNPVKNIWVVEFGLISCVLVIPLALICGSIRGIPFFWRMIDCSFGVVGFIPLWICRRWIKQLLVVSAESAEQQSPGWKSERSELWNPGSRIGY